MLEFERTVKAGDKDSAIHVFVDKEKGHTVYLSDSGMLAVLEDDKAKGTRVRAAGFTLANDGCGSCNGC